MNKFSRTARSVSFAAIVGLSLGISAPVAFAQEEGNTATAINPGERNEGAGAGNIDFSKTGAITIHKRIGAEKAKNNTGMDLGEAAPGKAIGDDRVSFTVKKVTNADLTTNEGFAAATKLTPKDALTQGEGKTVAVKDGVAEFQGLEIGVYLVEEKVTEQVQAGGSTLIPAKPFLVFVPTTGPEGNAWNYHVHVYPKNSESKTEKKVEDADKNTQDAFSYTITADAPNFNKEQKQLTKFEFQDKLDSRLEFVKVTEVKAGDQTLSEGDYDLTKPSLENENTLTVSLNEQGRGKVESGAQMSLKFEVKRKNVGETVELKNQADVIFNNPSTGDDVKQKTNEVITYHGKLKVVKRDKDKNETLKGAEFELYRCDAEAESVSEENKITIGETDKWTTGEDGTLTIDGLHVTDVEGSNSPISKNYCLLETKAPAGYKKNDKPISFTMTREDIKKAEVEGDDEITLVKEVVNLREDTPQLPLTGGAGVGILAAIGAAIVAAGAWFARRGAKN